MSEFTDGYNVALGVIYAALAQCDADVEPIPPRDMLVYTAQVLEEARDEFEVAYREEHPSEPPSTYDADHKVCSCEHMVLGHHASTCPQYDPMPHGAERSGNGWTH